MTEPTGWPHMLPCPFCGGDARHDAHADDCYFILHRKFKNSGADMSPAFEVLAAWNRRTQQPVVREPLTPSQYNMALGCATDIPPSRYEVVTRAIERAHGITQRGGSNAE